MQRTYKCRACGVVHEPPTGKHCPRREDDTPTDQMDAMMQLMQKINQKTDNIDKKTDGIDERVRAIELEREQQSEEQEDATAAPQTCTISSSSDDFDDEPASPETLRRDRRLMKDATKRLERLRLEQDEDAPLRSTGSRGRKSGSVLTATDAIVKTVDRPHMYVRRLVKGKRKGVAYSELKVEEFVFGFLTMLRAPENRMNAEVMLNMLRNIMHDAMEFTWPSARAFYETVGLDVEMGMLKWTDEGTITNMRMTYARPVQTAVRDVKDPQKPPLLPAPPNTKCCVPYQQRTCEQGSDHHPFVHACAYCLRTNLSSSRK